MFQCFMFQSLMLQHPRVCQCQPGRSKKTRRAALPPLLVTPASKPFGQRMEVLLLCPFLLFFGEQVIIPFKFLLVTQTCWGWGIEHFLSQDCFPGGRCSLPCLTQLSLQWGGQSPDCWCVALTALKACSLWLCALNLPAVSVRVWTTVFRGSCFLLRSMSASRENTARINNLLLVPGCKWQQARMDKDL